MKFYLLAVELLVAVAISTAMVLLLPAISQAQGNDFPAGVWAPSPSWSDVPIITPGQVGGSYRSGNIGPWQASNRRGAKITGRFVWDWWGLSPVQIVIRTSGDDGMHWSDGAYMWRGMCLQNCNFEFTATGDDTIMWIDWYGSDQFAAHLEVAAVDNPDQGTQPSIAIKQYIKDRALQKANDLNNAADVLSATAAIIPWPLSLIPAGQAIFFYRQARHFQGIYDARCIGDGGLWQGYIHDACELGCYWSDDREIAYYYNVSLTFGSYADGYAEAAGEQGNRTSCDGQNRDQLVTNLQDAGYWYRQMADYVWAIGPVMEREGYPDAANIEYQLNGDLRDAADFLEGAD